MPPSRNGMKFRATLLDNGEKVKAEVCVEQGYVMLDAKVTGTYETGVRSERDPYGHDTGVSVSRPKWWSSLPP